MRLRSYNLILLFILLSGLFLLTHELDSESVWLDEVISLKLADARPPVIIVERALNNHPPLYFLILHYWIKLFGNSVFSARALSAIFGFLSIPIIYGIGSFLFNKRTGILSAAILALSVFNIYYGQEIRMYSFLTLLTLASMYFFARMLWKTKGGEHGGKASSSSGIISIGYIITTTLLLYTHYSGLLVVLAQNIYFIVSYILYRENRVLGLKKWIKRMLALSLLYLPWFWVGVLRFKAMQDTHYDLLKPTLFSVINTFTEYAGSKALLIIFAVSILLIIIRYKKNKDIKDPFYAGKVFFLSVWLGTPVITPYVISQISNPLYVTKYTMAAAPALYLLAASGMERLKLKGIKTLAIAAVIILSLFNLWKYYGETNNLPWKEIARYIEEKALPGDVIIFNDTMCKKHAFDYYFTRKDTESKFVIKMEDRAPFVTVNEETLKRLEDAAHGHKRIWIALFHTVDRNMIIAGKFIGPYKLLYHKIFTARLYLTHHVDNVVEIFLFEKQ